MVGNFDLPDGPTDDVAANSDFAEISHRLARLSALFPALKVEACLQAMCVHKVTPKDVLEAVHNQRENRHPDSNRPIHTGNATAVISLPPYFSKTATSTPNGPTDDISANADFADVSLLDSAVVDECVGDYALP